MSDDYEGPVQGSELNVVASAIVCPVGERQISEAAYTMSECGQWPDGVTVSAEQLIKCWQVVEFIRHQPNMEIPERLKM